MGQTAFASRNRLGFPVSAFSIHKRGDPPADTLWIASYASDPLLESVLWALEGVCRVLFFLSAANDPALDQSYDIMRSNQILAAVSFLY